MMKVGKGQYMRHISENSCRDRWLVPHGLQRREELKIVTCFVHLVLLRQLKWLNIVTFILLLSDHDVIVCG